MLRVRRIFIPTRFTGGAERYLLIPGDVAH
jgi:hypothetical protein